MEFVQARFVTDDVASLARHYSVLVGVSPALNDYYVEVPAGATSIGFSHCRFTEDRRSISGCGREYAVRRGEVILDFRVDDVDAEFVRIDALGAQWVFGPTTQPWGARSMMLRDPEGHLINIASDR
ncbi:MAG TPA: VOC family protein [Jatrophihabitans sp.]|jgi:catechol 2,3-dioxygenase-like lactoylglutathione lyase family enzyme|nr:VOC family protein [Jatrophihabitans sp.]